MQLHIPRQHTATANYVHRIASCVFTLRLGGIPHTTTTPPQNANFHCLSNASSMWFCTWRANVFTQFAIGLITLVDAAIPYRRAKSHLAAWLVERMTRPHPDRMAATRSRWSFPRSPHIDLCEVAEAAAPCTNLAPEVDVWCSLQIRFLPSPWLVSFD